MKLLGFDVHSRTAQEPLDEAPCFYERNLAAVDLGSQQPAQSYKVTFCSIRNLVRSINIAQEFAENSFLWGA